jgi:hypothetical protein
MVSLLAGRDLLGSDTKLRQSNNLLRGVVGLLPGGEALYSKLDKTGALEEADDWLGKQIKKLEKEDENRSYLGSLQERRK